jgi:hypothetical protein
MSPISARPLASSAQPGAGRLLEHLLVPALHRAVALAQVHHMALGVGEHLDLDVARARDIALDQHVVVAEAGQGLALAAGQRGVEVLGRSTRRMPLPPPPALALISTG